jgi:aryl-alcohol dehydrogenase-like predicted oxidoreductase
MDAESRELCVIGFGTWPLGGGAYGPLDEATARAAMEHAVERGVSVFDTADIYGDGRVERLLASTVASRVEIIGKVGYLAESGDAQDFSWEHVSAAVRRSLQRLGRHQLDVLLLHSPRAELLADAAVRAVFERILEHGWAGRIGVSLRTVDDGPAALAWSDVSDIEVILNVLDQRALDNGLVDECRERGVRVLARLPLCSGLLSGQYAPGQRFAGSDRRSRWSHGQLDAWLTAADDVRNVIADGDVLRAALQFLLVAGVVPIPGMKTVEQVERSTDVARRSLVAGEFERLRALWRDHLTSLPPR